MDKQGDLRKVLDFVMAWSDADVDMILKFVLVALKCTDFKMLNLKIDVSLN